MTLIIPFRRASPVPCFILDHCVLCLVNFVSLLSATMSFDGWKFQEIDDGYFDDFKNTLQLVKDVKSESNLINENPSLKKAYENYQLVKKLTKG